MDCFAALTGMGHEQVVWCHHRDSGLRAIIAIHDTTLGPALGGCRFMDYPSEKDALRDVLRLSRGMTYKAAVAGLDLGGGKAVIVGDPRRGTEAVFRAFGRFVHTLGGRYVTAEDMNTGEREMEWIRRETPWVTGVSEALGGSGDPGPVTARGVYHGIRACLERVYGDADPAGRTVAIQGVGSVGHELARNLHEAGAELAFSDVSEGHLARALETYGGTILEPGAYFAADVDVLAPCAVGAVVNPETIPTIRAPIIAGSANNVLDDEVRDAEALAERGIVYAPDYVINAGGLISVWCERNGWPHHKALADVAKIEETVGLILDLAEDRGTTTMAAARRMAEGRIEAKASVDRVHIGD